MSKKQQIAELEQEVLRLQRELREQRTRVEMLEWERKPRPKPAQPETMATDAGVLVKTTTRFRGQPVWVQMPGNGAHADQWARSFDRLVGLEAKWGPAW